MAKKILLVSYYFPPDGGVVGVLRALKFVKFLPEFGWQPFVLTTDFAVGMNGRPSEERLLAQVPPNIQISRKKAWISTEPCFNPRNRLARLALATILVPDAMVTWAFPAANEGIKLIKKEEIQAIVTTSPPFTAHLVGAWLKKKTGLPWIADFRDAWLTDPDRNRAIYHRIRLSTIEKWQEAWVVRNADRIVTVSPSIRDDFIRRYPGLSLENVSLITNGYDPDDYSTAIGVVKNKKFSFVMTGSMTFQNRSPEPFLEGVRWFDDNFPELSDHYQVFLVGPYPPIIEEMINNYKLNDHVILRGAVPYHEALKYQVNADTNVMIYSGPEDERSAQMMSGKIFDYLGAGKPIMVIAPQATAASQLVRDLNIGIVVSPNDYEGMAQAMRDLIQKKVMLNFDGEKVQKYHRKNLAKQLAVILDELTGMPRITG